MQIFKGKSERCRGGGYSANERREIGSKVRGKYWMVMDWYRSGNEVVSKKKAERKGFNNTFLHSHESHGLTRIAKKISANQ